MPKAQSTYGSHNGLGGDSLTRKTGTLQQPVDQMQRRARKLGSEPQKRLSRGLNDLSTTLEDFRVSRQDLRRAQAEICQVMASVSDYLWSAEVDRAGRLTYRYYSPVVERIAGRPAQFYMPGPERWLSTIHPEDHPRLENSYMRIMERQSDQEEEEYRIVLPDGTIRWVRDNVRVRKTRGGKLRLDGVVSDITPRKRAEDELRKAHRELEMRVSERTAELAKVNAKLEQEITERKRAEEALRKSEGRFRRLTESNIIAIAVWDVNGSFTDANDAFLRLIGFTREEVASRNVGWRDITPPEYAWLDDRALEEIKMSGVCTPFEKEYIRKDGKRVPILIGAARSEDSQHEGVCFALDLTKRKRAEEALRKSEQQLRDQAYELEQQLIVSDRLVSFGELVFSLAHEFNNPLAIVIGFAQDLLTELKPSDPNYNSLRIIEEETGRCKKLIQDLLDFARPVGSDRRLIDSSDVVRRSIDLVSGEFQRSKVKTMIEIQPDLPPIYADPQQLEQVLLNLYFNAIEAMADKGSLTVRVEERPESRAEDSIEGLAPQSNRIVIEVQDTGHGITSDHLPNIFRPFFTARKEKGMGLGLSICDRIVKAHGGSIDVESTPGRGATFRLYFPVARGTDAGG